MAALRLALVAGELSGDILGAGLMQELKARDIEIDAFGVGGPRMLDQGMQSWWKAEDIAVMGLIEIVRHLPRLLKLKRNLLERIVVRKPDVFVGIDLPDFNLRLASDLHSHGIKTVQYVSPSVWAWRPKRVHTIASAIDKVLCLLPFEPAFYEQHSVDAQFVGHPLASEVVHQPSTVAARATLQLPEDVPVFALLPGSRRSEVVALAPIFLAAATLVAARLPEARFVTRCANEEVAKQWQLCCEQAPDAPSVEIAAGSTAKTIEASDVVLLASGTVALEALLVGRPMVVAYRLARSTAWIIRRLGLLNVEHYSLPNLLTATPWVKELVQDEAQPQAIASQMIKEYEAKTHPAREAEFQAVRERLDVDANQRAATAILELIEYASCSHEYKNTDQVVETIKAASEEGAHHE